MPSAPASRTKRLLDKHWDTMCKRVDEGLRASCTIRQVVTCSGPVGEGWAFRRLASPRSIVAANVPDGIAELSVTAAPPILTLVASATIQTTTLEQLPERSPPDLHRALERLAQHIGDAEDRLLLEDRPEAGWRGLRIHEQADTGTGLEDRLAMALTSLRAQDHRAPFALLLPTEQHGALCQDPARLDSWREVLQQGRLLACASLTAPLVLPDGLDDLEVVVVESYELGTGTMTEKAVELSVRGSFTLCERRSGAWHAAVSLPNADFSR